MKNILLLGANGQLGSDIIKVFQTINSANFRLIPATRSEFDIDDEVDYAAKLDNFNADLIINCIAFTHVDNCETNSLLAYKINSNFPYLLAKYCKNKNIVLFHISTDYIFNGCKTTPYLETDCGDPLNIYGLSKYAAEIAIKNVINKYFIFRVSYLYGKQGASGKGGNFITTMQRLANVNNEVKVIDDQYIAPTATVDIAKCIKYFIEHNITDYGLYNCASSTNCSIFEFATEIFKLSKLDAEKLVAIKFKGYSFKANRPQYTVLDNSKLNKYFVMPNWQSSLQEYFLDT